MNTGSFRPELILLPGLDGTGRLFASLIESLAECGVSARAIGYPAHEALGYVELEHRVRAELPAANPFVLLAESFSGPIALRIGAAPPANLLGLILSTTFAMRPTSLLGPLSGSVRWARLRPPMFLLDWFLMGPWSNQALRSGLAAALAEVSVSVLSQRAFEALHVDATDAARQQRRPSLILRASQDRLLGANAFRQLANALQPERMHEVKGPHLLLQTQPRLCAGLIAEFLQTLATA
ncbi:MAG: alpha/beta hydrolase [Xanthomonadales bacterium]|nr:alpha/beta hydrolase [Xanthomonadales bacterium]